MQDGGHAAGREFIKQECCMPEKERKKEMSLYTKVNTDLNFVEREHEVEQFWEDNKIF